jgi:hypothetical protein
MFGKAPGEEMQAVLGTAISSEVMGVWGSPNRRSGIPLHRRVRNKFDTNQKVTPGAHRRGWSRDAQGNRKSRLHQCDSTSIGLRVFGGKVAFKPAVSDGDAIVEATGSSVTLRASRGVFLFGLASLASLARQ